MLSTVEPLYNGHVGAGRFVHYKEVSFIERFVQQCICNPYKVLLLYQNDKCYMLTLSFKCFDQYL